MKDHRLQTSYENYKAWDVIAGSSAGGWTDREIALAMADFLDGAINQHPRYCDLVREVAEHDDADIGELINDLESELDEIIIEDQFHAIRWIDNELTIYPALESCLEDHQHNGRVSDELPEADSTHSIGETWMTVNERGNTSLYQLDRVAGGLFWREIWSIV